MLGLTGFAAAPASAQQPSLTEIALAWGLNDSGQLGNGTTTKSSTPVQVSLPGGDQPTAIAAGNAHSLALLPDGSILAWGNNGQGQLGNGSTTNSTTPVQVNLPSGALATDVAAGFDHSLAVTADGRVFAWGNNSNGQLGNGQSGGISSTPVQVNLPSGAEAVAVAGGAAFSLALTSDNRVFAWGNNSSGQLGNGTTGGISSTPVQVNLPADALPVAIAAGSGHGLVVTADGRVFAWGSNSSGQLGNGTTGGSSSTPVQVNLPAGAEAVAAAGGNAYSLALMADGRVFAWGENGLGQLGNGTTTSSNTPVQVNLPAGTQAVGIAAGANHALALTPTGGILAWGDNDEGQLGDGTTTNRLTPVPVILSPNTEAVAVAAGGNFSLALATVETIGTTTTVTASPTNVNPGQPVTLSAHVTCPGGTPTGTVQFFDGTNPIGNATLDAQGNATLVTTSLSTGTHQITAAYQGNEVCPPSVSEPVTVTVGVVPVETLTLNKQVVSTGPFKVGSKVQYAYTVTNTGNDTLTNAAVTDNLVTGVTCATTTLAPGQSTTCTGSHTVTKADVTPCKTVKARGGNHGKGKNQVMRCMVTNTATAAAIDPAGSQVASNQATATITVKVVKRVKPNHHCKPHRHNGHKYRGGGCTYDD